MLDGVGWAAWEGLFLFVSKALDTRVSRRQKKKITKVQFFHRQFY